MERLSITQFVFALEKMLVQKQIINSVRELDWPTVEYYKQVVLSEYPNFEFTQHQFKSFKRKYLQNKRRHSISKPPPYLENLNELLRMAVKDVQSGAKHQARPSTEAEGTFGAYSTGGALRACRSLPDPIVRMHMELSQWKVEYSTKMAELQSQMEVVSHHVKLLVKHLLGHSPQGGTACKLPRPKVEGRRPKAEAVKAGAKHLTVRSEPDFKVILQSLDSFSPRPFIRARQRVALLVLWISGLKVSQLLTLEVRHLKELRQGGQSWCAPPGEAAGAQHQAADLLEDEALGLAQDLDMLIGEYPDRTPAFRAKPHSARPSTREGLTRELNHILTHWSCSTKSLGPGPI